MASQTLKTTIHKEEAKAPQFHSEERKAAYLRITTRLAQESEHYFGEKVLPVFSIVRIIRRPFSDVIQCRVALGPQSMGLYIKFSLVDEGVEGEHARILKNTTREVAVTRAFFTFLCDESSVSVPEVIAFFPEELVVVTKEKKGVPLTTLISRSGRGKPKTAQLDFLKEACSSVGNALRVFQKMPLINEGRDELPENLITYIDLRLKLLSESGFISPKKCHEVLKYIETQLAKINIQELAFCGVHGDLCLSNVLLASDQVVILDLGMYRKGPSCFDLAYFHQHLDDFLTNPFFLKGTITQLQDAFFEGYGEDDIREHPLFLSYYIRNMVNQLLDLSRTRRLSLLRKVYQKWQYRHCLADLNTLIQKK